MTAEPRPRRRIPNPIAAGPRRPKLRPSLEASWAAASRRFAARGAATAALLLSGPVWALAAALAEPLALPARAADEATLVRLLEKRSCAGCRLQDADLVLADLRDADLRRAQLQRANLSQARLDGARLNGADLRDTSLQGASLRGADLRGALLEGTDLRQSDLSGALLDPGAIGSTHWSQAQGLAPQALSYTQLHNAGVDAFQAGNWPEAERFFGEALRREPQARITWVARAISRGQQNKFEQAASDFDYAATLFAQDGDQANARQLREAAQEVTKPVKQAQGGNGLGSQLLGGVMSLLPLAAKFLPLAF
jgi:tetratricopeptide (TPR) repeat protein